MMCVAAVSELLSGVLSLMLSIATAAERYPLVLSLDRSAACHVLKSLWTFLSSETSRVYIFDEK